MSNDSPASVVGNKFVLEYYSTLSKNPELISKYYTSDSVMSRGQASFEDEKQNSIQSSSALEGIQNAINTTNFKNCNFNLSGINCQKSFNRGVLLVVHGTITLKDQNHPRQFMQTFFLAPQTEPLYSYYVLNDIFNFIVTPPPPAVPTTVVVATKTVEEVHTHAPVQQQAANLPTVAANNNNNNNSNGTHHQATATSVSPIPAPMATQVTVVHPTTTPAASATTNNTTTSSTNNNQNAAPSTSTATAATSTVASSPIPPAATTAPSTTNATTTAAPATNTTTNQQQQTNKGGSKDNNSNNGNTKQNKANASNGTNKASNNTTTKQAAEPTKPRSPSWANVVNIGNSNGIQPNQIPLPSTPPLIKNKANRSNSASGGSTSVGSSSSTNGGSGRFKKGDKEKLQGAKHERSIYVGNLPFSCKEEEVLESFKGFGQIYEIVLKDSGYCFVQYYTPDSASKALAFKEKIIIGGRDLTIEPRKAETSDRPKKNKQKAQQ